MRTLLGLVLLAGLAAALDAPPELTRIFGGPEGWGRIPELRQQEILEAWKRYRQAPEEKRLEIERRGLREYLVRPGKRFQLPPQLAGELKQLPESVRPIVAKLAVMRLRTLQLDRNLAMIPFERRRPLFDRMFPRHFDREQAHEANAELGRLVSRAMAHRLLERLRAKETAIGRPLTKGEKTQLVREAAAREEQKVLGRIRKEIQRFSRADARTIRAMLEREGYHLLERHKLMRSPRQRELIRYAFRPERCPLIDLSFMGERPSDPVQRRVWDGDFRVLARIELLSGDFPPEMVLHLAAASSPADFFRAARAFEPVETPRRPR
jgi:hypothetical protein